MVGSEKIGQEKLGPQPFGTNCISIYSFISKYRVEEAKELLKGRPEVPVGKVGELAGFGSFSSFNRMFKKIVGLSPTEYRANKRNHSGL